MNLNDIKAMECDTLKPSEVASVLHCNPQWVREAARTRPDLLGFPTIVYGSRTLIPREAFIRYMEGL